MLKSPKVVGLSCTGLTFLKQSLKFDLVNEKWLRWERGETLLKVVI